MNLLLNIDVDDIDRAAQFYTAALTADPFGHGFCLVQFTGRGYDELVG